MHFFGCCQCRMRDMGHKKSLGENCFCQGISCCDPAGIQTQDLQNRNLTLYSAKLRSHFFSWCKDSARRAENKGKLVFLFLPRRSLSWAVKPKCARRAENKGKLAFLFLQSRSLSCERTRNVCGRLVRFRTGLLVKSARRLENSTSTAEISKRLADFQGWRLSSRNWFSAVSRVRGRWSCSRL